MNQNTAIACEPAYNQSLSPEEVCEVQSNLYRVHAPKAALMLVEGGSIMGTAIRLHIDRSTLQRWVKLPHFAALLAEEKDRLRSELLGTIRQAGKKEHLWTANAWLLERCKAFEGEFDPPAVKVKQQVDLTMRVFTHFQVEDLRNILEVTRCTVEEEPTGGTSGGTL